MSASRRVFSSSGMFSILPAWGSSGVSPVTTMAAESAGAGSSSLPFTLMSQGSWATLTVGTLEESPASSAAACWSSATRAGSGTATCATASHSVTVIKMVLGSARLMVSSPM